MCCAEVVVVPRWSMSFLLALRLRWGFQAVFRSDLWKKASIETRLCSSSGDGWRGRGARSEGLWGSRWRRHARRAESREIPAASAPPAALVGLKPTNHGLRHRTCLQPTRRTAWPLTRSDALTSKSCTYALDELHWKAQPVHLSHWTVSVAGERQDERGRRSTPWQAVCSQRYSGLVPSEAGAIRQRRGTRQSYDPPVNHPCGPSLYIVSTVSNRPDVNYIDNTRQDKDIHTHSLINRLTGHGW